MGCEPTGQVPVVPITDQTSVLGGLLWLCQHSQLHCNYPVGMLLDRVIGWFVLFFKYYL